MKMARRVTMVGVCMGILLAGSLGGWSADGADNREILRQTGGAFADIAKSAIPSVVFIKVEKSIAANMGQQFFFNDPSDFFGDDFMRRFFGGQLPQQPQQAPQRQFKQMGQGSGFLITKDGYILTNNHVVGDVDKISVTLSDGRDFDAELIGTDAHSEVALIRIKGDDFPFLDLGDSGSIGIGEWVIAVGNPFGLTETVTVGVVSAKGRNNLGIADYEDFIQTDAAINPGNSGGPLLNIDGKVIGINTAIYSQNGGYMGIGFAIPINMAKSIKDQLMKTGKVVRGYLGIMIQDMTQALAESFDLKDKQGILISDVTDGSPAQKAGLQQGDIILKLNNKDVEKVGTFRNAIASMPPDTKLTLGISREGKEETITATTGSLPDGLSGDETKPQTLEKLGLQVEDLKPELAQQFGYDVGKGVIVAQVQAGSDAKLAGIQAGNLIESVNRVPVSSVAEFQKALAKSKGTVLLLVRDNRGSRFVVLNVE